MLVKLSGGVVVMARGVGLLILGGVKRREARFNSDSAWQRLRVRVRYQVAMRDAMCA